jgi:cell pole-organizing protein PopZ
MGDVSTEPTMEEILSSIKRVIEESETAPIERKARPIRNTALRDTEERPEVLELSDRAPFPEAPVAEPVTAPVPRPESILSAGAVEATRGSLEALSRLIVKPEVAGGDTLEGLVREMLRPMLREWLDAHLPDVVEAMVAKEIARISGRGL